MIDQLPIGAKFFRAAYQICESPLNEIRFKRQLRRSNSDSSGARLLLVFIIRRPV